MAVIFWIAFCIGIGLWGQNKGRSFWFGFLLSMVLSPVIGAIIVGVAGHK